MANVATAPDPPSTSTTPPGKVLAEVDGYRVIDDELCGFAHVDPLPSEETLRELYEEHYFGAVKPIHEALPPAQLEWYRLETLDRFRTMEASLPSDRRTVLDLGSGPGKFLFVAQERGWKATGIDPSPQAIARCQAHGLDVHHGFFTDESASTLGQFDAVHLGCILEHVPKPITFLKRALHCLKPGGLLAIFVPNDFSPLQEVARWRHNLKPWWVVPEQHLNYFNPDSLRRLLAETLSLDIVELHTTFPLDLFLAVDRNYVGQPELGKDCFAQRQAFERNLEGAGMADLKRSLYRALTPLHIGREILAIARKPELSPPD